MVGDARLAAISLYSGAEGTAPLGTREVYTHGAAVVADLHAREAIFSRVYIHAEKSGLRSFLPFLSAHAALFCLFGFLLPHARLSISTPDIVEFHGYHAGFLFVTRGRENATMEVFLEEWYIEGN